MASMTLFWLIAGIAMIILELLVPGGFVLFVLGLAAVTIFLVTSFFSMGWMYQVTMFFVAAVMYLVLLRDNLKKLVFKFSKEEDPENEFVGKIAKAITPITATEGKVEFKGTQWPAKSDWPVLPGEEVEIISQESILLIVKPSKS